MLRRVPSGAHHRAPERVTVLAAIGTFCLGTFFLASGDAVAKILGGSYSPLQIIFVRSAIAVPVIMAIAASVEGAKAFRTPNLPLHILRGVSAVSSAYCFFLGLTFLPLAEATSIAFSAPLFLTVIAALFLKESIRWRQWAAMLVGFAGILLIVQPGAAAFQPAAFLLLATAFFHALFMAISRFIGQTETTWAMIFHLMIISLMLSGAAAALLWETPRAEDLPLFALHALFATLGLAMIAQGFRLAPASVIAPFGYISLIWASLFGWFLWGEIPRWPVIVGASLIACSCFYIARKGK